MKRDKDFGGFLGQAFELVGNNAVAVLIFIAVLGGLNTVGLMAGLLEADDTIAGFGFGFMVEATDGLANIGFELGLVIVTFVASYLLLARYLESSGRLPHREIRVLSYLFMAILSGIGTVVGFLFLIIPGLILMVRWSAASGFLIGARRGVVESLGDSWEATRGSGWPIFFAGLVTFIAIIFSSAVLGGIAGISGSDLAIAMVSSIAEAATNAVFLAFGIGVFLLVHDDTEEIGEVFA